MRWNFLSGRPLVITGVGAAPHRHFAVAKGLLRQPFHNVVAVFRFLSHRAEFALRTAAATHIDKDKNISIFGEIIRAGVIAVANIWRKGKDHGKRRRHGLRFIDRSVELYAIAHRDFGAPYQINLGRICSLRICGKRKN